MDLWQMQPLKQVQRYVESKKTKADQEVNKRRKKIIIRFGIRALPHIPCFLGKDPTGI